VRASRLLSLLLLLQTRGRMTAQELSAALEVSVRTVYRDVESLSGAGVPVYADRGPTGGYRLLDGYRTRLTGMTVDEAETLFLAGMPGPAADLGLGALLAAAELKLLAALPPELGDRAGRVRDRFHLDAPGWFRAREPTPHLGALADAVWRDRLVEVRYRRWKAPREVSRTLAPLGVVLKAGRWYLVARAGPDAGRPRGAEAPDEVRTYRVAAILELAVLDETFERDGDFDLAEFWRRWAERYERGVYRDQAVVRMTAAALELMAFVFPPAMARGARESAGPPDESGWLRTVVPIESIKHGHLELLKLGAEVEILGPPELRDRFLSTARALGHLYPSDPEEPT
jgi:predicted DNA-binding transcriptional regulator YafY